MKEVQKKLVLKFFEEGIQVKTLNCKAVGFNRIWEQRAALKFFDENFYLALHRLFFSILLLCTYFSVLF